MYPGYLVVFAPNFLWALNLTLEPVLMIGMHNSTHCYCNSAPGQKTELFPAACSVSCHSFGLSVPKESLNVRASHSQPYRQSTCAHDPNCIF